MGKTVAAAITLALGGGGSGKQGQKLESLCDRAKKGDGSAGGYHSHAMCLFSSEQRHQAAELEKKGHSQKGERDERWKRSNY